MNNLNSLLVEGVIAEIKEYSADEKKCVFTIESNRFIKVGKAIQKKTNVFTVIATGKLAVAVSAKKKGTGIRVIGVLDTAENNAVFIDAEHIEFKPGK